MRFDAHLRDTIAVHASRCTTSTTTTAANRCLPTIAMPPARGGHADVDVGLQAEWLDNTAIRGNGYYSPDHYLSASRRGASSYIALGPEAGLYLSAALGIQRDETFDNWKRAERLQRGVDAGHLQPLAAGRVAPATANA